jgi:hypothetical protein
MLESRMAFLEGALFLLLNEWAGQAIMGRRRMMARGKAMAENNWITLQIATEVRWR